MSKRSKAETYLVISDVHVPSHNVSAVNAVCDLAKDLQPSGLVINGDFLDLIELSKHSKASVAQLEGLRIAEVFKRANGVLDQLQKACGPQAQENYMIDGNHEDRLRRWIESGDNSVWLGDEATSIAKRLRLKDRNIAYREGYPKAYVKLGHLMITHGRWCGKYAAAVHLDRYRTSVLVGHVHTPGAFYASGFEKQQAGFVTGHLADASLPALSYAPVPNSWSNGFAVVTVEPNGNFHVELKTFVEGAFYYAGKRYGKPQRRT